MSLRRKLAAILVISSVLLAAGLATFIGVPHPQSKEGWHLAPTRADFGSPSDVRSIKEVAPKLFSELIELDVHSEEFYTLNAVEQRAQTTSVANARRVRGHLERIAAPSLVDEYVEIYTSSDATFDLGLTAAHRTVSRWNGVHVYGDTAVVVGEGHAVYCFPNCEPWFETQYTATFQRAEAAPNGWILVEYDDRYLNPADYT